MTREEMEQIAGLDLDVPEQRERALAWRIEDRPTLEWVMGTLADAERESLAISAECDAARARIRAVEDDRLGGLARATSWIRDAAMTYAREHRGELLVRGKTARLVHGEIAYVDRTKATVEVTDADATLAWCRSQPEALGLIRTKYEIDKKALDAVALAGPVEIPGVKIVPPASTITLKPSQPETIQIAPTRKEITP